MDEVGAVIAESIIDFFAVEGNRSDRGTAAGTGACAWTWTLETVSQWVTS